MKSTFRLKFRLDDSSDIHLDMTWVEGNETKTIPPKHWPVDSDDMDRVQWALFPRWVMKVKAFKARRRVLTAKRKRYYEKLMPDMRVVRVKSRSTGKEYTIIANMGKKKKIECSCPDYVFRRKQSGTYCKHISAWLKEQGQNPVKDTGPSRKNIRILW